MKSGRDTGTIEIKTQDLRIGMFVVDVGRSWLTHPWATKSKHITSHKDIEDLVNHGINQVIVDPAKRLAAPKPHASGQESETSTYHEYGIRAPILEQARQVTPDQVAAGLTSKEEPKPPAGSIHQVERRTRPRTDAQQQDVPMEAELPRAQKVYRQALETTREFIAEAKAGRNIDVPKVQASVNEMIDSVFRNRDSIVTLLKLKTYDEYTFTHSLNVAALAIAVGRQIGLSRTQLLNLGLGAIFHDIGKTAVPEYILNKPTKLSDEEFTVMKTHPVRGAAIVVKQAANVNASVIGVVRHHHERLDGTGYPDGLAGEDLDPFQTICGMCDVYDALTGDRIYRQAMAPHEALKVIFSLRDKHFPQSWVERFVQCLGIYPPGTLVKINSGETCVVIETNHSCLIRPRLKMARDARGRTALLERVIDLNLPENESRQIVSIVDHKEYQVDLAKYFNVATL